MKKIEITKLKEFENHPYHVKDDAEMEALVESINEHGIWCLHLGIFNPGNNRHSRKHIGYAVFSCSVGGAPRRILCK